MRAESDKPGLWDGKRHSRRLNAAIALVAERQHGVIALEQLLAIGLTEDEVRHRIRTGWLRPVHRRVFAVAYEPLTPEGGCWAGLLAVGNDAVLSHVSAAKVWGLVEPWPDEVHVTVAEIQRRPHTGVTPHRNRLDRTEITVFRGIPVTTPLRTILDLAAGKATVASLERAIRQAEYEHLTTAAALGQAVLAIPGRRGVRNLRRALLSVGATPGVTRSDLEERFVRFVRRRSLPKPTKLNVRLALDGRRFFEVDCLWEPQKVIVELDGRAAHIRASAFEADRARDAALQAAGYVVVRVTWWRLHRDAEKLAAELRAILAHRK
jgi:very-short-patch-repair endonuclease